MKSSIWCSFANYFRMFKGRFLNSTSIASFNNIFIALGKFSFLQFLRKICLLHLKSIAGKTFSSTIFAISSKHSAPISLQWKINSFHNSKKKKNRIIILFYNISVPQLMRPSEINTTNKINRNFLSFLYDLGWMGQEKNRETHKIPTEQKLPQLFKNWVLP